MHHRGSAVDTSFGSCSHTGEMARPFLCLLPVTHGFIALYKGQKVSLAPYIYISVRLFSRLKVNLIIC